MSENIKFTIDQNSLGSKGEISLSRSEYKSIFSSKSNLVRALGVEERFDILMENFFEFELEILSLTSRSTLFFDFSWDSFSEARSRLNRRLLNLLAGSRAYIDQTQGEFSGIFGKNTTEYSKLKAAFSREYDNNLEYRALESLRNYTQHYGYPIYNLNYSGSLNEKSGLISNSLEFALQLSVFEKSKKVKKEIIRELRAEYGDQVKLKPLIRKYIEGLIRVHVEARLLLKPMIAKWDTTISGAIARYDNEYGTAKGLAIQKVRLRGVEDDGIIDSTDIFDELIIRRRTLESKNGSNTNLAKQEVSSHEGVNGRSDK